MFKNPSTRSSGKTTSACMGLYGRLRSPQRALNLSNMKLQDVEREALGLNEQERARLVLSLMDTLGAPDAGATDDEVEERDAELDSGAVEAILHEEFVRRVQEARGR